MLKNVEVKQDDIKPLTLQAVEHGVALKPYLESQIALIAKYGAYKVPEKQPTEPQETN
jgi:hypothetical protein